MVRGGSVRGTSMPERSSQAFDVGRGGEAEVMRDRGKKEEEEEGIKRGDGEVKEEKKK